MKKYVKAINDICTSYGIKCGDVCVVVAEYGQPGGHVYTFDKRYGDQKDFWAWNFVEIACPCNVKNCLKHVKETRKT